MAFQITITEDAESQMRSLSVREQRILEAAILARLQDKPTTPTRAIKRLRPNPLAEFELRAGDLRVLYNVEGRKSFFLWSEGKLATNWLSRERSSMDIKTIPLSRLEADPRGTLTECADSGQAFVIELPDQRLVAIQGLEPAEDDSLTSELLESNEAFQKLVAKSKAGPRKPFPADSGG